MSAFPHTSWTVYCDHPRCTQQVTDKGGGTRSATRAGLRRYLVRRGWTVSVPVDPSYPGKGTGLDYCPEHKPAVTQ